MAAEYKLPGGMEFHMGLLDEIKRLARPYDDDDDYEDFTPKAQERIPVPQRPAAVTQRSAEAEDKRKVVNIHATTQLQVVLLPERFENSAEIADHLRDKRTVVLNLELQTRILPEEYWIFERRCLCTGRQNKKSSCEHLQ